MKLCFIEIQTFNYRIESEKYHWVEALAKEKMRTHNFQEETLPDLKVRNQQMLGEESIKVKTGELDFISRNFAEISGDGISKQNSFKIKR